MDDFHNNITTLFANYRIPNCQQESMEWLLPPHQLAPNSTRTFVEISDDLLDSKNAIPEENVESYEKQE